MHQVKLFKSTETELSSFESEINDWIRSSGARVLQLTGNISEQTIGNAEAAKGGRAFSPSDLFVAVLYEIP